MEVNALGPTDGDDHDGCGESGILHDTNRYNNALPDISYRSGPGVLELQRAVERGALSGSRGMLQVAYTWSVEYRLRYFGLPS